MGKKIMFIDLDGTLMRDDNTISAKDREAISKAVALGNYITLATGRAISSARNIVKDLGLTMPGCYLIAFNGATIYDCSADCILSSKKLPIEHAEFLYNEANAAGLYIQAYSENQILASSRTKELDYYVEKSKMSYRIEADMWSMLNEEPPKMLLISLDGKGPLRTFQQEHADWEKDKCISFFSSNEYLEYCPLGATKGCGVEFLRQFLNIPHEDTIALGDQENDITMIKSAHIGIAMNNAAQRVKESADFITMNDNNNDAVAEVIERFVFGERNEIDIMSAD